MIKTPDTIDPRDERHHHRRHIEAPRAAEMDLDLDEVDEVKSRRVKSPLGAYLELTGISTTAFSRASGIDHKTVKMYADGGAIPEIPKAVWIEVITKGVVPVEAWCALPRAKKMFRDMSDKCDPAIREQLSQLPGGGFSSPLQKDPRGVKSRKKIKEE